MDRVWKRTLFTATAMAVIAAFVALPTAHAKGDNVTFKNVGEQTVYVLATYQGDSCGEMQEKEQLELEPGETLVLQSADSVVCFCSAVAGKIGDCRDSWQKAKPGSKQRLGY